MKRYQQDEDEMWSDPNNWKWGIFYFNPNDERLFVPKKNPSFGATLNFANPRSYILFIPLMFFILFVIFAAIFQP
jgi:uncharacterized membrane protein